MPDALRAAVERESERDGISMTEFLRRAAEHFARLPPEERRQLKFDLAPPMTRERRAEERPVDSAA